MAWAAKSQTYLPDGAFGDFRIHPGSHGIRVEVFDIVNTDLVLDMRELFLGINGGKRHDGD
jgi:hypothetical protein